MKERGEKDNLEIFGLLDRHMRRKRVVCLQSEVEGEVLSSAIQQEMSVKYAGRLSSRQWDEMFKCRILRGGQIWWYAPKFCFSESE